MLDIKFIRENKDIVAEGAKKKHIAFDVSALIAADDKRRARLNCITHLLSLIPYKDLTPKPIKLPPLDKHGYIRPPITDQTFVPETF